MYWNSSAQIKYDQTSRLVILMPAFDWTEAFKRSPKPEMIKYHPFNFAQMVIFGTPWIAPTCNRTAITCNCNLLRIQHKSPRRIHLLMRLTYILGSSRDQHKRHACTAHPVRRTMYPFRRIRIACVSDRMYSERVRESNARPRTIASVHAWFCECNPLFRKLAQQGTQLSLKADGHKHTHTHRPTHACDALTLMTLAQWTYMRAHEYRDCGR